MATGVALYRRTNNLNESEPLMTRSSWDAEGQWTGFKRGQPFHIPVHDNNIQCDTIESGLVKVQPDHCGKGLSAMMMSNQDLNFPPTTADASLHGINGCQLSAGAHRTFYINETGDYFLETQASFVIGGCNHLNVKMECSGGAATASPADSDPLGFSVDATTGAIVGTPQRVRDGYKMRLRAVDAADVRATVAEWTFDVKAPPEFSLRPATGWAAETDGKLASKYHVAETHLLPKPRLATEMLLQHPAGSNYGDVVYLLSAKPAAGNPNCTVGDTEETQVISALTDVATGAGAINIQCEGNYRATLVVRDGAGAEVTARSWNFAVRPRDTAVPEYGPNGGNCTNGVAVDGTEMDGAFTCDCAGTRFTGNNCEVTSEVASAQDDTTAYVIGR